MKRLFAIKDPSGKLVPNEYFPDKKAAKARRDELNDKTAVQHCVTYGPDHYKFKR